MSGKKNDHIECRKCESIYHTDVIEYKPAISDEEMESEHGSSGPLCLQLIHSVAQNPDDSAASRCWRAPPSLCVAATASQWAR